MKKLLALLLLASTAFAGTERIIDADKLTGVQTEKNYVKGHKGDAELASAAATYPGWTCTGTATIARTTSSPLAGTGSLLFSSGAAEDYCYTSFTIDAQHKAKVLTASFEYDLSSGSFALGDVEAQIYDVTNSLSVGIAPTDLEALTSGAPSSPFAGEFQTNSNSTSYQLRLVRKAGTGAIRIDSIAVGRKAKVFGAPVTDWQTFTPDFPAALGLNTTSYEAPTGRWRRDGDSMDIHVEFRNGTGGDASGTGDFALTIPSGFSAASNSRYANALYFADSSASYAKAAYAGRTNSAFGMTQIRFEHASSGARFQVSDIDAGDFVIIDVKVPISGWSSSLQMSDNADTRVVSAFYNISGNTAFNGGARFNFDAKGWDTHGAVTTGAGAWKFTAPSAGYYAIKAGWELASSAWTAGQNATATLATTAIGTRRIAFVPIQNNFSNTLYVSATPQTVYMAAGDTAWITTDSSIAVNALAGLGYIAIDKVQGPSQIAASETVRARIGRTANQTLAPNGGIVQVQFDDKTSSTYFDSHGAFNTTGSGTGPYAFIAPVAGTYLVSTRILIASTNVLGNDYHLYYGVNGANYTALVDQRFATAGVQFSLGGTTQIRLNAGDTLGVYIYGAGNNSVSTLTLNRSVNSPFLDVVKVGNY